MFLQVVAMLHIDSGTRARDVIRSIGGIDYRMHLYGDESASALSSLWQASDAYLIQIGSDTQDPNGEESIPKWYMPLKSTGTWSLDSTDAAKAIFSINNFPLNWPLSFPIDLIAPEIDVVYQEPGKESIVVATAHLKEANSNSQVRSKLKKSLRM